MAGRVKYLVFGLGMLVLAAGVSISVWIVLDRSDPALVAPPPLSQALMQAMGLTEEEADALVERLQAAVEQAGPADATGGETSLAQALQLTAGLSESAAGELAERLLAAAEQAGSPAPTGGGPGVNANLEDSVDFEVRDGSGKLKQRETSR